MQECSTYRECLDPDNPDDECADIGRTSIDDSLVDNLDALGPASIVAIVVLAVLVVLQRDGASEQGVGRDGRGGPLVALPVRGDRRHRGVRAQHLGDVFDIARCRCRGRRMK